MLGRGLADLLPVGGDAPGNGLIAPGPGQEVPIALLHPNPRQPRTRFDEAAMAELAESIKSNGVLQPILVRPLASGGYEIVAGERRYRASLRAGLRQVPVVVRQLTDDETLALALIENLIREDIGPLEAARAYQRLMTDFGWTQEETGRRVGKSRSAVANTLRLLRLPDAIQQSLEKGELTEGHARCLIGDDAGSNDPQFRERQMRVYRKVLENGLTVREAERLMRGTSPEADTAAGLTATDGATPKLRVTSDRVSPPDAAADADLRAIEDRLRDALGTRVRVHGSAGHGRIEIDYFSADELDGLVDRLDVRPAVESITPGPATPGQPRRGSGLNPDRLLPRPPIA